MVCLLVIPAAAVRAAFSDGEGAAAVLGQYGTSLTRPEVSFTKGDANNGLNILGLNYPSHTVVDPVRHRLFVTDSNNKRILVYALNSSNTLSGYLPAYVIGQADFTSKTGGNPENPYGLAYDSVHDRLFVSYYYANRVLVYDTTTITNGMSASYALGQPDLTSMTGATTRSGMKNPLGLAYDTANHRLFVTDTSNNRVLVFSGASLGTGMEAHIVLGQSSFTGALSATTQVGMNAPQEVAYDSDTQHVFVTDYSNNRVLVFSGSALGSGMSANTVIGQTSFTASAGGTSQTKLSGPIGITYDTGNARLFVADYGNRRVLAFDGASLSHGMAATTVLGQSSFTGSTAGTSRSTLVEAYGLSYTAGADQLFVGDSSNNRIMIFDGSALSNGADAVDLIGQYASVVSPSPAFGKSGLNDGPNVLGFRGPYGIALDRVHHRLFVVEYYNHRVLVFTLAEDNTIDSFFPSYVIGQPNFYTNTPATTRSGLRGPTGVAYDPNHDRLFVAEYDNNRILVFELSAIANGMDASHVIGQTLFTTATGAITRAGMRRPYHLEYDAASDRLFAAFYDNHRVLVYSGSSIATGMDANTVLGQSTFTGSTAATTQSGLNGPIGLAYDSSTNRLFVGQHDGNRISVFSGASLANGMNAVAVLGQSSFTASTAATTRAGLRQPYGIDIDSAGQRLFVADYGNHRVLTYSTASLATGMEASGVLGQSDFTSATAATTRTGMSSPLDTAYSPAGDHLYAVDFNNNRILLFGDLAVAASDSDDSTGSSPPRGGGRRNARELIERAAETLASRSSVSSDRSSVSSPGSSASHVPTRERRGLSLRFSDVPASSWFAPHVASLVAADIASGYRDEAGNPTGEFGPGNPVTYAEIAKMALLAGGQEIDDGAVPGNASARSDWSAPYVVLAERLLPSVYPPELDVRTPATRAAVIRVVLEALSLPLQDGATNPFRDLPADHPHARAILTAAALGLVSGDTDGQGIPLGTVRPDDLINRAEVAKILVLAVDLLR